LIVRSDSIEERASKGGVNRVQISSIRNGMTHNLADDEDDDFGDT